MKTARYAVVLTMIVIGLVLALDIAYYVHGSLEEFPEPEDHEKVRTAAGFIGVVLLSAEAMLWFVLRRLRRAPHLARVTGGAA
ncbi:hypothetical protein [Longimicrobium sp.]|jgi:uncharacterized membrane-anchored protein|uniref:hypothetical protein n=1 Tax=Longimicrobium sp. TaxID=2029185 RepID=UPI002F92C4F8